MENNNNFIKPEEISVSNLFDNIEYVIPIYQRNYAWGEKEIIQLLIDINDSGKKSNYYLGNLIVDKNKPNSFYVIDGQQRLTTLFLLFKCLYENDEEYKNNWYSIQNSLRFEAREISNIALKNNFEEFKSNDNNTAMELKNGFTIIKNYIKTNKIVKNELLATLKNIKIIRTQVPENIDLNHYFEIMNTRGEQLELHEIVKSNILSIEGLDDIERKIIAKIWDACSQMDSYVQMNFKPHIRKVLFGSYWNVFNHKDFKGLRNIIEGLIKNCSSKLKNEFSIVNKDDSVTKDILEDIFEIDGEKIIELLKDKYNNTQKENSNTDRKTDSDGNSLISILSNPGKYINNEKDKCNSQEENERFESIVSFPSFLLIVNETIIKSKSNNLNENDATLDDKNFIETLRYNWSSKKEALDFIYSLLKYRFLFDKYIIKREFAKIYKDTGKWSLQKLKKHNKKDSPKYLGSFPAEKNNHKLRALQSVFRITYTSPKTMHWISKILSEIDINYHKDKIIYILEEYACNKISESNYNKASGFGFSRIIFTYLDYLLIRDKNESKFENYLKGIDFDNFEFQFRNSIEHFSPQTGGDFSNNPTVLNSFGNLALITVSGNSKFSNMTPNQKIDKKNESIVNQSPKLMIMASYCNKEKQWNEKMVEIHKEEMFEILKDELKSKGIEQSNE